MENYILLVENNPDDAETMRVYLKKWGITNTLVIVQTGEQALEILQKPPLPIIVMLDLKLTDLTGVEILKKIKNDPCCRSIPVVIYSGSDMEDDWINSFTAGANGYIVKPLTFDTWIQTLLNVGLRFKVIKK